jgi:selenocysteine lyase/cysteine desulfurase
VDPFLPDDQKVAAIRELLPATGAGIYLDTATAGPFPAETDRALREADDWELRVGRVGPDRGDDTAQRAEEARSVIAAVLGVDADGVILTTGPRAAASALSTALRRGGGGPAVLAGISTVDAVSGRLVDVRAEAARARAEGATVVVDASFSAGAIPIAHHELDADAVVLGTHRWLLGPEGVTALWLRPGLDRAAAAEAVDLPPRRALLAVARSVAWLLMYVGLPWAMERTRELSQRLQRGLAGVGGVHQLTRDPIGPLVALRVGGWPVDEAADELSRRASAIVGRDPEHDAIRASVGAWNREEELDRFVEAVAELARHTPGSLPRRPPLVVMAPDR